MSHLKYIFFCIGVVSAILIAHAIFFTTSTPTENTIIYTNNGYEPKTLRVPVGTTVTFENQSDTSFWPASDLHPNHGVYPEFDTREMLGPSATWQFTFDKVGPWGYHDHVEAHHIGSVIVYDPENNDAAKTCEAHDGRLESECFLHTINTAIENDGPVAGLQVLIENRDNHAMGCHLLTHEIGLKTYAEYGTAFDLDASMRICAGGFFHGLMEGMLSDTYDIAAAAAWCTKAGEQLHGQYPDTEGRCAHGIGHGVAEHLMGEQYLDWKTPEQIITEGTAECDIYHYDEQLRKVCLAGVYSVVIDWVVLGDAAQDIFTKDDPFKLCRMQGDWFNVDECMQEFSQRLYIFFDDDYASSFAAAYNSLTTDEKSMHGPSVFRALALQYGVRSMSIRQTIDDVELAVCTTYTGELRQSCIIGLVSSSLAQANTTAVTGVADTLCGSTLLTKEEQRLCHGYKNENTYELFGERR